MSQETCLNGVILRREVLSVLYITIFSDGFFIVKTKFQATAKSKIVLLNRLLKTPALQEFFCKLARSL